MDAARRDELKALFEQAIALPGMGVPYPVQEEHLIALRDAVALWDTTRTRLVDFRGREMHPGQYAELKALLTALASYGLNDNSTRRV